jgi:ribosomal protein S18 acetylase RimI-like enzyme
MKAAVLMAQEAIALRPMRDADIPAIRDLHARAFATLARDWHTPEQIAAHVALIQDTPYPDDLWRSHITIAEVKHDVVATSGWLVVQGEPRTARIRKVFVDPAMARRGLGSMMVRHAEQQAREAGFDRLIVRANINAVGLYTKLGYAETAKSTMMAADGIELPVMMMEKYS